MPTTQEKGRPNFSGEHEFPNVSLFQQPTIIYWTGHPMRTRGRTVLKQFQVDWSSHGSKRKNSFEAISRLVILGSKRKNSFEAIPRNREVMPRLKCLNLRSPAQPSLGEMQRCRTLKYHFKCSNSRRLEQ
ncbi:uncharacterized protein LOC109532899 isoform X2 [Dendroctonus ponderosae]|uniref:uncharacterized protein LOC109532899 isoform X2 n=1 Tax=Dendroctonus ponderosae TaxID=77166 RepID=UPI0020356D3C|nr:uncharacterized protein LOC109532899 isoform X2 [Dendroctonus ponderosae]